MMAKINNIIWLYTRSNTKLSVHTRWEINPIAVTFHSSFVNGTIRDFIHCNTGIARSNYFPLSPFRDWNFDQDKYIKENVSRKFLYDEKQQESFSWIVKLKWFWWQDHHHNVISPQSPFTIKASSSLLSHVYRKQQNRRILSASLFREAKRNNKQTFELSISKYSKMPFFVFLFSAHIYAF